MDLNILVRRISHKIRDDSYTSEDLVAFINQGIGEIASTVALPDLETVGTIECGAGPFVALPSDYYANLQHAYNQTQDRPAKVMKAVTDLRAKFPSLAEEGAVTHVSPHGKKLYFQCAPGDSAPETLLITYSKQPQLFDLEEGITEIDYLPHLMQAALLVNYACREAFDEIEDGVEGPKIEWSTHNKLFNDAMGNLREFLGIAPGTPTHVEGPSIGEGYFSDRGHADLDDILI